ncbi:MAG: PhzF family phenazine biosynthesis isomerase [Emcibacteraceae bacterium]|nr:PhzF family phenazine biosynthesis isomerase [Emcibacteraceae bacterium]
MTIKIIKIHLVDAFTDNIGEGNRAGVVFNADELTDTQMQDIAAYANVSETAFLISSSDPDSHEIHVRYFTPSREVPICGHATIASHFLRAKRNQLESMTVLSKTGVGILPVEIQKTNDDYKIIMTQGTPEIGAVLSEAHGNEALTALGLNQKDIIESLPIQFASTGHGKVVIPIKDVNTLHSIKPDFEKLKALTNKIDHTGYFVLTLGKDDALYKTHGRMFAPSIGINEDPVTGNGNGPAGLYLSHHNVFQFQNDFTYFGVQGEAMGKPGVIEVSVFKENGNISKVQVAGSAVEAGMLKYQLN